MMDTSELETSELGTQEYWDNRYKTEVHNFKEFGDEGDVWFGEDIIDRIMRWIEKSSLVSKAQKVIDLGCGNGMLLVELAQSGFENLLGVDYSKDAIELAKAIRDKRNLKIEYKVNDILKSELESNQYELALDKGTYDAISLSEDPKTMRNLYIDSVHDLLVENGLLLITSCNWTQEELCQQFEHKFSYCQTIPTPQFKFGGKVGSVVSSIVLRKK